MPQTALSVIQMNIGLPMPCLNADCMSNHKQTCCTDKLHILKSKIGLCRLITEMYGLSDAFILYARYGSGLKVPVHL